MAAGLLASVLTIPAGRRGFARLRTVIVICAAVLGAAPVASAWATPAWLAPVDLSVAGQNAEGQRVAVDAAGNATAVWSRFDGTNFRVQAASRPAGGVWQSPVDLSVAGQNADSPQIAVNAAGNATAVWSRFDGTSRRVQAASRPAGGVWQSPVDLSDAGQSAEAPQIAVNAAGNATRRVVPRRRHE